MAGIGVLILWGWGELGERGRDWDTDIVGVGTEISEYLVDVT